MEMHQVRYFLAVSRTLNFTRAAEECHVSQPSLTKAIQKLEEELGGQLFRRERGLTHLTDLGRLMLPHLEQTYAAAQAARSLAQDLRNAEVAPLRLGIADSIFLPGLHDLLRELSRGLPGLQLSVRHAGQAEAVEAALRGELDVLVLTGEPGLHDRLRLGRLAEEPPVLLCPPGHRLAEAGAAAACAGLAGEAWVARPGCPAAEAFLGLCREQGGGPVVRHEAHSDFALQQMVLAGMGCALGWAWTPRLPGLAAVPVEGPARPRPLALATVVGRPFSRGADAFLRLARARSWDPSAEPLAIPA